MACDQHYCFLLKTNPPGNVNPISIFLFDRRSQAGRQNKILKTLSLLFVIEKRFYDATNCKTLKYIKCIIQPFISMLCNSHYLPGIFIYELLCFGTIIL